MSDATLDDEERAAFSRLSNFALIATSFFAFLALRRYWTWHNETFDLAFYTRQVWGLSRSNYYEPLTGAHALGTHAAPILLPFAFLGRVLPIVPLLLVVQAASLAGAGVPLARMASRRIRHTLAGEFTLLTWLLFPTISTIATYEFHPSALALLPLAIGLDALDDSRYTRAGVAFFIALLCREDVGLILAVLGTTLLFTRRTRAFGALLIAVGTTWFVLYVLVIAPRYIAPGGAGMALNFKQLGRTPGEAIRTLLFHPIASIKAILTPGKWLYLPRLLAPLAFLPLLAPRWMLPALIPIAMNVLSSFPPTIRINSHYATLTLPFLFAAAIHGATRILTSDEEVEPAQRNSRWIVMGIVGLSSMWMHYTSGATPLSMRWDPNAFIADSRAQECEALVALIPSTSSVRAPDYVLPHIAERQLIRRTDPAVPGVIVPEVDLAPTDDTIVSLEHRRRFFGQGLWRCDEEAPVRRMLADRSMGVVNATEFHLLVRKGYPPRAFAKGRYIDFQPLDGVHADSISLGPSITLAGWGIRDAHGGSVLTLLFQAHKTLPHDMGLQVGWDYMRKDEQGHWFVPHVVDAEMFDGYFSPSLVRVGEVVRTEVFLPAPSSDVTRETIYIGVRKVSGYVLDDGAQFWMSLHLPAPH